MPLRHLREPHLLQGAPVMKCERLPLPGDGAAMICSRGSAPRFCACGRRAVLLCDAIIEGTERTCSRGICTGCAVSPKPGTDYCPMHPPAQGELSLEGA